MTASLHRPPLFAALDGARSVLLAGTGGGFDADAAQHRPRSDRGGDLRRFGDGQFTTRTAGSTLFVNPLMAASFAVDLLKLAGRCLYLDRIEQTVGMRTPEVFPH